MSCVIYINPDSGLKQKLVDKEIKLFFLLMLEF